VGIPKHLPSYAGVQLVKEINMLLPVVTKPAHPFVFILGGAKFATKIPLISRFIDSADSVIIAGALLNSFYKTVGFEVGKSVVEDGYEKQIKALLKNPNLLLPLDVIVLRGDKKVSCSSNEIQTGDVVVDIGPQSVALIIQKIAKAKLVVWNGPTGWYEKGYTKATTAIANAIVEADTRAVIGGGDTGAVVEKVIGENKKVFISTGGGATIDFLSTGTLPGITALG
jgi:phosphoglycerate kinase